MKKNFIVLSFVVLALTACSNSQKSEPIIQEKIVTVEKIVEIEKPVFKTAEMNEKELVNIKGFKLEKKEIILGDSKVIYYASRKVKGKLEYKYRVYKLIKGEETKYVVENETANEVFELKELKDVRTTIENI